MGEWRVSPDYVKGARVFVVYRDDPGTGKRETIGTFDDRDRAEEFADALNVRRKE